MRADLPSWCDSGGGEVKEILFAGVGGQGVVLLSKLLASAYVEKGYFIKTTETIGMAQMGGSVTSHLRGSKDKIHSPFLVEGTADIVFGFEPSEVLRNSRYLNSDTKIILHDVAIKPVTDTLSDMDYDGIRILDIIKRDFKNVYICNFSKLFEQIGTDKPMNIGLLGVAIGLDVLGIGYDEAIDILKTNLPKKVLEKNLLAFEEGYKLGKSKGEKNER